MRPFCCFFLPFTTKRPTSSCAAVPPPPPLLHCNATVMAGVAARAHGQLVIVYHRMHSQPECWTPPKAESRAQIFPRRDNLQKIYCLVLKAGLTSSKLLFLSGTPTPSGDSSLKSIARCSFENASGPAAEDWTDFFWQKLFIYFALYQSNLDGGLMSLH